MVKNREERIKKQGSKLKKRRHRKKFLKMMVYMTDKKIKK